MIRQKRRNLLFAGAALSLLVHVSILWYLDSIHKASSAAGPPQSVFVEFNTIEEEELTNLEQTELATDTDASLTDLSEMPDESPALDLDVQPPAAELEVGDAGSMPTLGGSAGGGGDLSLGGGGATTSFMGISSRGTRFCYIVDISGSMSEANKLGAALRELSRSVDALPDFAYFHVLLFSSDVYFPSWQEAWSRAREHEVRRLLIWLDQISPGGGTSPMPAFQRAFALETTPDVIFFLTDGQIPAGVATQVANLNRGSRRCVINTIAFGDPRSQDQLKEIANESGGLYRFVRVNE